MTLLLALLFHLVLASGNYGKVCIIDWSIWSNFLSLYSQVILTYPNLPCWSFYRLSFILYLWQFGMPDIYNSCTTLMTRTPLLIFVECQLNLNSPVCELVFPVGHGWQRCLSAPLAIITAGSITICFFRSLVFPRPHMNCVQFTWFILERITTSPKIQRKKGSSNSNIQSFGRFKYYRYFNPTSFLFKPRLNHVLWIMAVEKTHPGFTRRSGGDSLQNSAGFINAIRVSINWTWMSNVNSWYFDFCKMLDRQNIVQVRQHLNPAPLWNFLTWSNFISILNDLFPKNPRFDT